MTIARAATADLFAPLPDLTTDVAAGLDLLARLPPVWPVDAERWSQTLTALKVFEERWGGPARACGWSLVQLYASNSGDQGDDTQARARAIIQMLAGGLMELHDCKRRAMTVVSCLQVTWPIIEAKAVESVPGRFEKLPVLETIKSRDVVENLIAGRVDATYAEIGFHPPYRTWPFRPESIDSAVGLLPRKILIHCKEHRDRCIAAGQISECASLVETSQSWIRNSSRK